VVFIRHELHAFHKIVAQKVLGDVQALELVHGLNLLLSFDSSIVKGLIFDLYSLYLLLNLRLPFLVIHFSSFVVFVLKFPNFFKFVLLLNFKSCLIDTFA